MIDLSRLVEAPASSLPVLAIVIESPEASFPEYLRYHFGNLQE
jgi:hypothetical protein